MRLIATAAIALGLSSLAHAQVPSVVIPHEFANVEAPSLSTYPFSYQQCRWQMVIDGNEICTNTATLLSMEFRPDQGAVSTPFSGTVLMPQIDFYVTNTTPVGMTTTYAQNWGNASPTTVYSIKTLNIPSSTGSFPAPLPFQLKVPLDKPFLYTRALGNLLIDWTENQSYVYSRWSVDATQYWWTARPSSTKVWEDKSCTDPAGNQAYMGIGTSGGAPGQNLEVKFTMKPSASNNLDLFVNWLGFSNQSWGPIGLPLDLTGFRGWTGCQLAVSMDVLAVATTSPVLWPIPNDPLLAGATIFTHGMAVDSVKGDMVMSYNAYSAQISPLNGYSNGPSQMVYRAKDNTQTSGYRSNATFYAPVIKLNGVFN